MNTRSGAIVGLGLMVTCALGWSACGGGDDDDDIDPNSFRVRGNLVSVTGAAPQSVASASTWQWLSEALVRPAIAQSLCSNNAEIEICLDTEEIDGRRTQNCFPVDRPTCAFDTVQTVFRTTQLFLRDARSGKTAPIGDDVDPLQNGCRLLLCNVTLDFDRQVADPEALINSCAEPNVPFDCAFALSRNPRSPGGGGGGGGRVPTAAPTSPTPPNLTPVPSRTFPPTPTPTNTPNATNTPEGQPTANQTPSGDCSATIGQSCSDSVTCCSGVCRDEGFGFFCFLS